MSIGFNIIDSEVIITKHFCILKNNFIKNEYQMPIPMLVPLNSIITKGARLKILEKHLNWKSILGFVKTCPGGTTNL